MARPCPEGPLALLILAHSGTVGKRCDTTRPMVGSCTRLADGPHGSQGTAMNDQRITLVTLGVADLQRSAAFYERLGWTPHPSSQDSVVFYQANGMVLGLFGRDDLADDQGRPGADLGTGAITLAQNHPTVAAVDAAWDRAMAAGAKALKAPEEVFWGGYSGYWSDPDGHVWEVAMNPFWPLAEDGSLVLPDEE